MNYIFFVVLSLFFELVASQEDGVSEDAGVSGEVLILIALVLVCCATACASSLVKQCLAQN